jgi:hypothetical protein
VILNDVQGAKHILYKRKMDLNDLKKSLTHISEAIKADDNKLNNEQLKEKKYQFELLVNNVMACYADFDSQGFIVSEYLDKKKIQLKHYYEDMENDDTRNGIIVVPH